LSRGARTAREARLPPPDLEALQSVHSVEAILGVCSEGVAREVDDDELVELAQLLQRLDARHAVVAEV